MSKSPILTFQPCAANSQTRRRARILLPTPPFCETIATMKAICHASLDPWFTGIMRPCPHGAASSGPWKADPRPNGCVCQISAEALHATVLPHRTIRCRTTQPARRVKSCFAGVECATERWGLGVCPHHLSSRPSLETHTRKRGGVGRGCFAHATFL